MTFKAKKTTNKQKRKYRVLIGLCRYRTNCIQIVWFNFKFCLFDLLPQMSFIVAYLF